MKTKGIVIISLISAILIIAGCKSNINQLTELEKAEDWELLFDGESMDNWKAYNAEGTGSNQYIRISF